MSNAIATSEIPSNVHATIFLKSGVGHMVQQLNICWSDRTKSKTNSFHKQTNLLKLEGMERRSEMLRHLETVNQRTCHKKVNRLDGIKEDLNASYSIQTKIQR